ncbi:hypothetical protein LTR10_007659 [Elasticomyces elasticus]|nr:hypothetical protein LTR10_007659 [Elasticomyces elasticus]KAK4970660.1 hypothetical protein LTR42_007636 [Elasticomyces elasticus]
MKATLDQPGSNVLSPTKLAHVVLRSNNFDAMRAFYKTFLGATPAYENHFLCFLRYDSEHHRLGIVNMPIGPKNAATSGLEHISFTFNTLEELAMSYLQRQKHGIEPFWCVNHGPTTSVYYHDPDGNTLETQVDNFDNEEAEAFMLSEAYEINPLGVDFTMKDLIARLQAGEDDRSIKQRPASGPRGLETVPL